MSRARLKRSAGELPERALDPESLKFDEQIIQRFWREAAQNVALPTPEQLYALTIMSTSYLAQRVDAREDKFNADIRVALNAALKWCKVYRPWEKESDTLPRADVRDRRVVLLEQAICAAYPLTEPTPTRTWEHQAWHLWFRMRSILEERSETARHSATSHTVIFMSKILIWMGHPQATPDAISGLLRGNKAYRQQN